VTVPSPPVACIRNYGSVSSSCIVLGSGVSTSASCEDRVQFLQWAPGNAVSRPRIAVGMLVAVLGTAWWAGALPELWASAVNAMPYMLLGLGVVGGLRVLAPWSALAGPILLLVVAVVWLLVRYEILDTGVFQAGLAGALVFGGFVLALTGRSGESESRIVRRYRSVLWPRKVKLTEMAPGKLSAVAVLAPLNVDLTSSEFPSSFRAIEIDITVLAGHIDLVFPTDWSVVLGRIHGRGIHLDGKLDLVQPFHSPADLPSHGKWVIINIMGLTGGVTLGSENSLN